VNISPQTKSITEAILQAKKRSKGVKNKPEHNEKHSGTFGKVVKAAGGGEKGENTAGSVLAQLMSKK